MEQCNAKREIISKLKKEILLLQGFKPASTGTFQGIGLGPLEAAFPNAVFPIGVIHEFLCFSPEHTAASGGFIAGLLKSLMHKGSVCLWISASRKLFPPALKAFGIEPDRIIFIDPRNEKDVLWTIEEALKCEGLAAVVGEVGEINLMQSRRLQLAVEKSRVTCFLLRNNARRVGSNAFMARWKITPISSEAEDGLPGVGFPRWTVELLKVRNGNPGTWNIKWSEGRFNFTPRTSEYAVIAEDRKTG